MIFVYFYVKLLNSTNYITHKNGGCYDIAKRIKTQYQEYSLQKGINFKYESFNDSILSPDDSTLFCTSGMHHFKNELSSSNSNTLLETQTFTNIQKCLRLNDLDSIDDLNDRTVAY